MGGRLGASDAAAFALDAFSSFSELLTDAGGDALSTARQALSARFAAHERDGVVTMNARVHVVTGVA
jgi:hypothetical protein